MPVFDNTLERQLSSLFRADAGQAHLPLGTWQSIAPRLGEQDGLSLFRKLQDAFSFPRWRNPMKVKYVAPAATAVLALMAVLLFVMLVNNDDDNGNSPAPAATPTVLPQPTQAPTATPTVPPPPTPDVKATADANNANATATAQAMVTPTPESTPTPVPTATATPDPILAPYQAALDAGDPGPLPQGGYLFIEPNAADPSGRTDNRLILRIEEGVITFPQFQGNVWKFKYTSTEDRMLIMDPNNYCGGTPVEYNWTFRGEDELLMTVVTRDTCFDRRVFLEPYQNTGEGWHGPS